MVRVITTHLIAVAFVFAVATVYDVELSYNDNFLATQVQQSFLATADSVSEVVFFCGKKIVPGKYQFRLEDSLGNPITLWIESDSAGLFEHELVSASFNPKINVRKGFTYRLAVTHNQDSLVNFYYNSFDPYPDGQLIGQPESWDLAARITGINEFRDELFGMNAYLTFTHSDPTHKDTIFWARDKWKACIGSMKQTGIT